MCLFAIQSVRKSKVAVFQLPATAIHDRMLGAAAEEAAATEQQCMPGPACTTTSDAGMLQCMSFTAYESMCLSSTNGVLTRDLCGCQQQRTTATRGSDSLDEPVVLSLMVGSVAHERDCMIQVPLLVLALWLSVHSCIITLH